MPYIQARSKFETTMNNLKGIVGTLFITHTEGYMMTEKFKEKIKEMIDTGLAQAVKTGNAFNWLSRFSILTKPYQAGNYDWYSFKHRDGIIPRELPHMFVDLKEAEDIYDKVAEL